MSEQIIDSLNTSCSAVTNSYLNNFDGIRQKLSTANVTAFLEQKKNFLEQNESINSIESKEFNKQALNMQSALNRTMLNFQPLLFDNQCVIFEPNVDETDDNLIGEIEWNRFIFPTVVYLKLFILKIYFICLNFRD